MNRKLIALLLANLFVAPAAFAQAADQGVAVGDLKLRGFVGIGGIYTDEDSQDKYKLNEYQDLSNGAFLNFGLTGRGDRYWLNYYGENIGRDDMYVDLRGGMYDLFKYRLYGNWLTHNFGYNLRSPYGGIGSSDLRTTFPQFNVGTWNTFDMNYERQDNGVGFEWSPNSPWYAKFDFNQVKFDGTKLYSASNGTSPGNGFVDLPGPVDYRTNNVNVEGGYQTRDLIASVSLLWSNFDNKAGQYPNYFTWTNPYFGPNGIDQTYMPPSNDYFKVGANGALRNLPWNSTLAARFTWSKTESDQELATRMLNYTTPTGTPPSLYAPITANTTTFNGKEENTTFSLSWTAIPMAGLDTKVYYNYYDRNNKSNDVEFNTSALNCTDFGAPVISPKPSVPCEPEKYSYTKNNFGIQGYYRLDRANRIAGGWDYWDISREGTLYDDTTTNTFWAEWMTTMIPDSTFRAKVAYQQRRSDYLDKDVGISPADPIWLERYTSQFDQQDRDQWAAKLSYDTTVQAFDIGLEFNYQYNKYKDVTLGRTKDTRYGLYGNLGWGDPKALRFNVFADFEWVEQDAYHRYIGAGNCSTAASGSSATGPNCFDPNTPPFPAAYNWNSANRDETWFIGASMAWPINDQLKFSASAMYGRNNGGAEITADVAQPAPFTVLATPINDYDTYSLTSINLRLDWRFHRNWELSGGYSYQKYNWKDDQYNNFTYLVPLSPLNTSTSYFSGAYAQPNYDANIFWVIGKYYF